MISRRKFIALLAAGPLPGKAALASVLRAESKRLLAPRKTKPDDDSPGFCAVVALSGSLAHWLENPLAPRRSYRWAGSQTDDAENDLPVPIETVERWRRILRKWAPSVYRQVLLNEARRRRDPEWCKATPRQRADAAEKALLAAGWKRVGASTQI